MEKQEQTKEIEKESISDILTEFGLTVQLKDFCLEGFKPHPEDFLQKMDKLLELLFSVNKDFPLNNVFCPQIVREMLLILQASLDESKRDERGNLDIDEAKEKVKDLKKAIEANKNKIFFAEKRFLEETSEKIRKFHDDNASCDLDSSNCESCTYRSDLKKIVLKSFDLYVTWKEKKSKAAQPKRDRIFGMYEFCDSCNNRGLVSFNKVWRVKRSRNKLTIVANGLENALKQEFIYKCQSDLCEQKRKDFLSYIM